ncbi:MAG: hypothetical protein NTW86_08395, partial [Candidatus Sumerlaeota bacterium]|nr:hypothetical protein [Candidatus Sumerlaeota bacterium]
PYFAESPELALPLLFDQRGDFARAGVAYGTYLFSRLEDIPRSVRVYFFLNAFAVDEARAAKVRRFLDERKGVAVWLFAPGAIREGGFSAQGAWALTGLPLSVSTQATTHSLNLNALPNSPVLKYIRELPPARTPPLAPTVYVKPNAEGCVTLAPYDLSGGPGALAAREMEGGWVSVFCALPRPGIGLIRGLAEYAGAHVWTDSSDLAVRAGGCFLSVNCARDGRYEFRLPRPADRVVDLLRAQSLPLDGPAPAGEVEPRADRFSADLKAGEYSLFLIQYAGAE